MSQDKGTPPKLSPRSGASYRPSPPGGARSRTLRACAAPSLYPRSTRHTNWTKRAIYKQESPVKIRVAGPPGPWTKPCDAETFDPPREQLRQGRCATARRGSAADVYGDALHHRFPRADLLASLLLLLITIMITIIILIITIIIMIICSLLLLLMYVLFPCSGESRPSRKGELGRRPGEERSAQNKHIYIYI